MGMRIRVRKACSMIASSLFLGALLAGCPVPNEPPPEAPPSTPPEPVVPVEPATPAFSLPADTYGIDLSIAITCSTPDAAIYYTKDGTIPTSSSLPYEDPILVKGDGKYQVLKAIAESSGLYSEIASAVYSIDYSGGLDTTFNSGGAGANMAVKSILLSGSDIFIGGAFTSYNGVSKSRIARLRSDGILYSDTLSADNEVLTLAIQPADGKILLGGDFSEVEGYARDRIARISSSGSLDTGFATGVGASNIVRALAVQGDGKILVGGDFGVYGNENLYSIARINTDGSLDTGFGKKFAGFDNPVRAILLLSDGRILVGGDFITYIDGANSTNLDRLAMLNSDGSLDTSVFTFASGDYVPYNGSVLALAFQSDGKILMGGSFTGFDDPDYSTPAFIKWRLARLNADFTLDTGFPAGGEGANQNVNAIAVQSDGRILIGGNFTEYNGVPRGYIARLYRDGSLDPTFLATGTTGANNSVVSIAVQSDRKILIVGYFTSFNGISQGRVARLLN